MHKLAYFPCKLRSQAWCEPIGCRTISCGCVRCVAKTCAVILGNSFVFGIFIGFKITVFRNCTSSARFAMLAIAVSYSPICLIRKPPRLKSRHGLPA